MKKDIKDNEVFEFIEGGEKIDLFESERLVPRIDKHLGKKRWGVGVPFVDEDQREQLHKQLELQGFVDPSADAMNALLYLIEGKYGSAALSGASILPVGDFLKSIYKGYKNLNAIPTQTLYRGVRNINNPETLIKEDRIVGNWKATGHNVIGKEIKEGIMKGMRRVDSGISASGDPWFAHMPASQNVDNLLFTTHNKSEALAYIKNTDGLLLEFDVPIDYINMRGHHVLGGTYGSLVKKDTQELAGGWGSKEAKELANQIYPLVSFPEGLPVETLRKVYTFSGK